MAADPKDPKDGDRAPGRPRAPADGPGGPASPPAPGASGSGAPDLALGAVRLPQAWVHDGKERALVPSRPMIARDLDRAAKGQLVYVGRDGEVKDPARVRNRQVAWYLAFGGIMAVGVTLAATSLPLMIPFYAALCGRLVGQVRAVKRVNQASAALSNGDTAAGRALAEPVSRAWWAPGRVRILAELRVAFADALDGRGDQALERLRHARAKLSPRLVQYQFSYYTEINLLIALGRIKEARALLDSRGGIPSGEVLRFSHWIAEMHLGVAEGKLDIDDDELHTRQRKGLSMTTGRDLLLLCSWAYAQRDQHDDAAYAWRQAMEREGTPRIDVTMPSLVAWMTGYLRDHPELEHPTPDDDL